MELLLGLAREEGAAAGLQGLTSYYYSKFYSATTHWAHFYSNVQFGKHMYT